MIVRPMDGSRLPISCPAYAQVARAAADASDAVGPKPKHYVVGCLLAG